MLKRSCKMSSFDCVSNTNFRRIDVFCSGIGVELCPSCYRVLCPSSCVVAQRLEFLHGNLLGTYCPQRIRFIVEAVKYW